MRQTAPGTTRFHHIEDRIDHLLQVSGWPSTPARISFPRGQQLTQFLPSIFTNIAWIPFPFALLLLSTHGSYVMLVLIYITALSWVRF